jgi:hypothetical protein
MTRYQLLACNRKQLDELAREKGIVGWRGLRKDDLIAALHKALRNEARRRRAADARHKSRHAPLQRAAARDTSDADAAPIKIGVPTRELSPRVPRELPVGYGKDRIVLMVRDPFWLHCYWELTRQTLERAEAALGQEWHTSRPILRLFDVTNSDTNRPSERIVRDIDIHGGCSNWYIDVTSPPRSFRVDIGYLTREGRFYALGRSNPVSTPRTGLSEVTDGNWADIDAKQADRIYAMSSGYEGGGSSLELRQIFEERLKRPLGSPSVTSLSSGGLGVCGRPVEFHLQVDADLVVYGRTVPNASLKFQNQPVDVRPDGTFTVRFKLPDSRQIIPCVAVSPDGGEERRVVLAIERNTRQLETPPPGETE